MSSDTKQTVMSILADAGINISEEEAEQIAPIYSGFKERLKALNAADLGDDGPAPIFSPAPPTQ